MLEDKGHRKNTPTCIFHGRNYFTNCGDLTFKQAQALGAGLSANKLKINLNEGKRS